jgi:hypothetical protein
MISGAAKLRESEVLAIRMRASILRVRLVRKKNWVAGLHSVASAAVAALKVSHQGNRNPGRHSTLAATRLGFFPLRA